MAGNHSQAWHDANTAVTDAERELASVQRHYSDNAGKLKDAADEVAAAKTAFRAIDRSAAAWAS